MKALKNLVIALIAALALVSPAFADESISEVATAVRTAAREQQDKIESLKAEITAEEKSITADQKALADKAKAERPAAQIALDLRRTDLALAKKRLAQALGCGVCQTGGAAKVATAKPAATPVAQAPVVDPLPGRLVSVACDGTIRSVAIPTKETRVELVGSCTSAAAVATAEVRTVVEDRRVVQVAPVAVAQATAAATATATFKAFCEAKFNNGIASEYVLADDASDASIHRACDGWAKAQLAVRGMNKPLNPVANHGKSIFARP